MTEVATLEGRVTRLENDIADIKDTITREIHTLRDDQIKDLKISNKEFDRRMAELERREYQRVGSGLAITGISHFISAAIGGLITALIAYFYLGGKPHP